LAIRFGKVIGFWPGNFRETGARAGLAIAVAQHRVDRFWCRWQQILWINFEILVSIGAVLVTAGAASAQLNNEAFTGSRSSQPKYSVPVNKKKPTGGSRNEVLDSLKQAKPRLLVENSQRRRFTPCHPAPSLFFKTTNTFNKIVDGYTLSGTQLNPQFV
jgi:hypothetical protein